MEKKFPLIHQFRERFYTKTNEIPDRMREIKSNPDKIHTSSHHVRTVHRKKLMYIQ